MSDLAQQPAPESLFGRIAVHLGSITEEQLVEATLQQGREGWERKLGEILLDLGWIDSEGLLAILDVQRRCKDTQPASLAEALAEASQRSTARPRADAPAINAMLEAAVARGASDLHLHSGAVPTVRVDGDLLELGGAPLPAQRIEELMREVLTPEELSAIETRGQADFSYRVHGVARFRGNTFRHQRGVDAVFRAIAERPPTLAELGMPSSLARLTQHHQGLVLITGPSGCGKSSTLAALVNLINEERREHILTAEQPIEYRHESKRSLVNQREIGRDSKSYADHLRAALREDPDVIALGELRDRESISLALTAAETGHLVIATLHTGSAIRTIHRLIGAFPPGEQEQVRVMLSESLRAVVSQRLVKRAAGPGRVPALELLWATRAVSNLIRENKTFQLESVLQLGAGDGMCSLDGSLDRLVSDRLVTAEEADRHRITTNVEDKVQEEPVHAAS
jgi:twitching motility protein PilT